MSMSVQKRPWHKHYVPPCSETITPMQEKNLTELLRKPCEDLGEKRAFIQVMPNGMQAGLSYRQVGEMSDKVALFLREVLGLIEGDRVGIQLPNCLAYPVISLGVWKAGGVVVNLNPLSTSYEMASKFKDCTPKVLFILDMFARQLTEALKQDVEIQEVVLVDIAHSFKPIQRWIMRFVLKHIRRQLPLYKGKAWTYSHLFEEVERRRLLHQKQTLLEGYTKRLTPKSLAVLQYTGGTSGVSKGVELLHENLMTNVMQIDQYAKASLHPNQEVILTALPIYHIFAFTVNFLLFFYNGATNILIPSPRPISNLRKPMELYPITWLTGVNTLFNALLKSAWFSKKSLPHIKASVAGGMALHTETARQWKDLLSSEVVEGYGLSETSPVVTFNPLGGQVKAGTIGIPLPSTDVKCVKENGKECKIGEVGEVIVKGPQVMKGYWKNESETEHTIKNGWLYTGDMAQMDHEGYFRIVDRKKDMILVSGYNVYPNEVEECIARMKEVVEVGVIGVSDDHSGEAVKAFVVVDMEFKGGREAIWSHCKQYLSGYKVPKYIEFREELPKTVVGKILRRQLKDLPQQSV